MTVTPIENMSPDAVNKALRANEILLVDVRETYEFEAEHIAGSYNLPLSGFDPAALPSGDGKYIVLSCAGGVRSVRAALLCQAAGINIHHHLATGLHGWVASGLPTERQG
ncbi:MAG: rhodanese-like domain-containing protein [Asticcacaulis sp.]